MENKDTVIITITFKDTMDSVYALRDLLNMLDNWKDENLAQISEFSDVFKFKCVVLKVNKDRMVKVLNDMKDLKDIEIRMGL